MPKIEIRAGQIWRHKKNNGLIKIVTVQPSLSGSEDQADIETRKCDEKGIIYRRKITVFRGKSIKSLYLLKKDLQDT